MMDIQEDLWNYLTKKALELIQSNKSNKLRHLARIEEPGLIRVKVNSGVDYTNWYEDGNHPLGSAGRIYPRNKKFLKFTIAGKTIFARYVRGYEGRHHFKNAQAAILSNLDNWIKEYIEKELKDLQ